MVEPILISVGVAALSLIVHDLRKERARRRRSERRRQRNRRNDGIWWATMWLGRDRRQKKLPDMRD